MLLLMAPATSTVVYAFQQSDGFARFIVALLFLLSIHAWTIMCEKGIVVRRARRATHRFLEAFRRSSSPVELVLDLDRHAGPLADIYSDVVAELMDMMDVNPNLIDSYSRRGRMPREVTSTEVEKIRSSLQRAVDREILVLERRMGLLGTAVTVSPFLGLLGTVWGVMAAFVRMAQHGRPDISAMAPGVSGALLTTVVGLVVAIPAVVGYNLITNSLRQTTVDMDNFVEEFVAELRNAKVVEQDS